MTNTSVMRVGSVAVHVTHGLRNTVALDDSETYTLLDFTNEKLSVVNQMRRHYNAFAKIKTIYVYKSYTTLKTLNAKC